MRKLRITMSVFLVIVGIGILMLVLSKDSVVISIGIRSYRGLYQGGLIAEVALVILFLILSLRDARKKNAAKKEERENQLREREQSADRQKLEADLPVNGRLTDVKVRELLKENASGKWRALQDAIGGLAAQMCQMDSYQERLANLLTSNQASTLGDTEEVLDQVEQYICRNIRKVLNYMTVYDPASQEDAAALEKLIEECRDANQEQLTQTKEFVFALTEFLNRQGDSSQDTYSLELYKKLILDSIKED